MRQNCAVLLGTVSGRVLGEKMGIFFVIGCIYLYLLYLLLKRQSLRFVLRKRNLSCIMQTDTDERRGCVYG